MVDVQSALIRRWRTSALLSDLMKVHDKEAREYYAVGDLRKARDNERIYGSIQARRTRFDAETLRIMKK
jgi:hypothetical protein